MKQDTNKLRDESPVDELFARRLARHSVKPDPAAWERLQTRLAGDSAPRVVVFWQNPAVYRYAAAACVVVLLLAGGWWFLRPTNESKLAQNQPVKQTSKPEIERSTAPQRIDQPQPMVARRTEPTRPPKPTAEAVATTKRPQTKPAPPTAPTVEKPAEQLAQTDPKPLIISAVTISKPAGKPITGRVLVVTIAEPDALIEARQAANWSESAEKIIVLDANPKPAKDSTRLAQRRRGNPGVVSTDDQSLLNLAYRAIKNKVTTNKSLNQ